MTFFGGMKSRYQIGAYKSHCIRRLYPYKVLAEDSLCPKWYCWLYIMSYSMYPIHCIRLYPLIAAPKYIKQAGIWEL